MSTTEERLEAAKALVQQLREWARANEAIVEVAQQNYVPAPQASGYMRAYDNAATRLAVALELDE